MPVSVCFINLTKAVGANAPPCRMPQRGSKFTIGHVLVGSLKRVIDKLRVDGMFLQAAPDRHCRPAGAAFATGPCQREGRVVDIAEPHAVRDNSLNRAVDFRPFVGFKLAKRKSLQHLAETLL